MSMERLTQQEAADFLGVSRAMMSKLQREGQLDGTYYRVGARVLYIKDKLQAWAESGGTAKGEQSE